MRVIPVTPSPSDAGRATSGRTTRTDVSPGWLTLLVAGLSSAIIFANLGHGSLIDWDEATYAQIAKEMVESGDWLTPRWGGALYLEKPPLYVWSVATFFRIFEVSEFWARAPSALSGVALALLTVLIGAAAYGRAVGCLGALILVLSYGFLNSARFAMLDTMVTCAIYLALFGYVRLRERGEH